MAKEEKAPKTVKAPAVKRERVISQQTVEQAISVLVKLDGVIIQQAGGMAEIIPCKTPIKVKIVEA